MRTVSFHKHEIKEIDYNFIISNLILSQKETFTYTTMLNQLNNMFGSVNIKMKDTLNKSLVRLRDDGFLSILGSNYKVIDNKNL